MNDPRMNAPIQLASALVLVALASGVAQAQLPGPLAWSITWKDATIALPDTGTMLQITESDLLAPGLGMPAIGVLPTPTIGTTGGELGLPGYTGCIGHAPGTPCGVEIDALSAGRDAYFHPRTLASVGTPETWFSVDEWSVGVASPSSLAPHASVDTEAPVGDASGDIFIGLGLPPGPAQPMQGGHNVGVMDGNGRASASGYVYLGLGNREPNTATGSGTANEGDDLDAFDIGFFEGLPDGGVPPNGAYFSLDASFVDRNNGHPNSGSAAILGLSGGHVLRTAASGVPPTVYAPAQQLGLDLFGVDTDDLDALILRENGVAGFQPSLAPFDWLPEVGVLHRDMLLFSVRRGSRVVGELDSIFGLPIRPADVLTTPLPTSMGGVSPFPGIFMAGENLGLFTNRFGPLEGDDLNALDSTEDPCFDCNMNGVEDSADIAAGTSADANKNGIPDECEGPFIEYCKCPSGEAPCANASGAGGCRNSTGVGGRLQVQSGSDSVFMDDLVLRLSQLPLNQSGVLYMGGGVTALPFGDGLRCVNAGGVGVFRHPIKNSGASGSMTYGPGLAAFSCAQFTPPGCIQPGETWYFQGWYRDPPGPCGTGFNLTNGMSVQFGP